MMILKQKPHTSIQKKMDDKFKQQLTSMVTGPTENIISIILKGYHPNINIFSNNASITVLNYVGI